MKIYFDEKSFSNTDSLYKTSKKSMSAAFVHYGIVARVLARHVEQSEHNYCSESENQIWSFLVKKNIEVKEYTYYFTMWLKVLLFKIFKYLFKIF